ncbi:hypothetical protein EON65_15355, partial [archaeon]
MNYITLAYSHIPHSPNFTAFLQGNKQTASFNSLTLKAVNKAVASNELEKVKHSFKLTGAEKERRREAEKKALGLSGLTEVGMPLHLSHLTLISPAGTRPNPSITATPPLTY